MTNARHDPACVIHSGRECDCMPGGEDLVQATVEPAADVGSVIVPVNAWRSAEITFIPPSGLVEGPGWQPIVTAPVDGTEVILFYLHLTDDGFVTAGHYHRADGDYLSHWYADLVNGGASPPTHWMPLPLPPDDRTDAPQAHCQSLNQPLPRPTEERQGDYLQNPQETRTRSDLAQERAAYFDSLPTEIEPAPAPPVTTREADDVAAASEALDDFNRNGGVSLGDLKQELAEEGSFLCQPNSVEKVTYVRKVDAEASVSSAIERCAKWHDDQAANYAGLAKSASEQGEYELNGRMADIAQHHMLSAAAIRSLLKSGGG